MRALRHGLAALLFTAATPLLAGEPAHDALIELNTLRAQAGMDAFRIDQRLAAAALGHARYLLAQPGAGHIQRRGGSGFTGAEPLDRARQARYPAALVSENIAQGNSEIGAALDGLTAAIYHRLGFLDFDLNSVGIGYAAYRGRPQTAGYVFLMSNTDVVELCAGQNFDGTGQYVYSVCSPDIRIEKGVYDAARARFGLAQPELVVWPPDHADDVPPAFFDESPDPLPDVDVSGYPISVSINPFKVDVAKVTGFRLLDLDSGQSVTPLRALNAGNDPNRKLDAHQFAWFPLERLRWGGRYRAELGLELDGRRVGKTWDFRVRDVPGPLYTLRGGSREQAFVTEADGWVTVFVPPEPRGLRRLSNLEYRYPQGASVDSEFLDGNTLRLRVHGQPGTKVRFEIDGGLHFDVVLPASAPGRR